MKIAFHYAYQTVVKKGNPPFNEYIKHLGKGFKDIMKILSLPETLYEPFIYKSNQLTSTIQCFPGVSTLLETLNNKGYLLSIATGKEGERARKTLQILKISQYFHLVVGSDQVPSPKPAPDILFYIMNHFKKTKQETLFIGDSTADIEAGHAANVFTCGALWGYSDSASLTASKPKQLINTPLDLLAFLRIPA